MSNIFKENDFEKILRGRNSIREYDKTVKISQEEMQDILSETVLAPSSANMQPWRFVVVESDNAKAKLKPLIRFNTKQNDTSSAMILIFGDLQCYELSEDIFGAAVAAGKMPQEVKEQQMSTLIPHYKGLSRQEMIEVVKIDGSLAAMQLMLVAKAHGYDTNPMSGFEADQLATTFDLDPNRYEPILIISIGKANETGYSSLRLPVDKIATWK
ncbi:MULTISPECIES: nitroreductase family protein [unclassified Enterococcus]|uniref:nitroreductase family protein n=1 Tax=unclassified Enterococcus TaxID=2608891 RepID=UPI0015549781|nr:MULTISPECIES: nitroreductase family protein [unclassified Enterococcus]MBS7576128.1 nitroreductase family protein [Enterococcus sp. MMGLQ5-2]MBS7583361.1 nitroreductase family protein [Enterococcus sp. MMGLQ5-1]NPD11221.1 nitroreductase family protein [Enterococcus sp. MMGLQ5-1]NPD35964.1 nitroreductase family protein [Enterococcus sp. MMGLQ5-2]